MRQYLLVASVYLFLITNDVERYFHLSPFIFHLSTFFGELSVPLHYFTYGNYQ